MNKFDKVANIKLLWNKIINLCSTLRSKYIDKLNGLQLWNAIKPKLLDVKVEKEKKIKWNSEHDRVYNSLSEIIKSLPEKNKEGKLIESNHFFLQLLNIPKKDLSAPFNRLLQIALNIGQLKPSLNDKKFGFNIVQIFNENKLSDINTYILDNDIEKYNITQMDIDDIFTILADLNLDPPLKESSGGNIYKLKNRYTIEYSKIN